MSISISIISQFKMFLQIFMILFLKIPLDIDNFIDIVEKFEHMPSNAQAHATSGTRAC